MKAELSAERRHAFRAETFRLNAPLTRSEQALEWVNERGFVFFWPIQGFSLPGLWTAVAGKRPVATEHDDPGHITWAWFRTVGAANVREVERLFHRGRKLTRRALNRLPHDDTLIETHYENQRGEWLALRELL